MDMDAHSLQCGMQVAGHKSWRSPPPPQQSWDWEPVECNRKNLIERARHLGRLECSPGAVLCAGGRPLLVAQPSSPTAELLSESGASWDWEPVECNRRTLIERACHLG